MSASLSPEPNLSATPVVAILAGGLATRLRPVTAAIPKSMVTVAGEPFIAHQMRRLSGQGLQDIVICLGHLGEQIEAFVGDGHRFECRVRYSRDEPRPLGTGGAIRQALPLLGAEFCVLYGDSYLTAPVGPALDAFAASGKHGLMTVLRNCGAWDSSNVEVADGEIIRYDKERSTAAMEYIDYGLSLFRAEVFHNWPQGSVFDLSEVQRRLIATSAMAGFEVAERFYEIGSMRGLLETDRFLRMSHINPEPRPASTVRSDPSEAFIVGAPV
jgi:NDP-sugar pyrophosphorylase family protein